MFLSMAGQGYELFVFMQTCLFVFIQGHGGIISEMGQVHIGLEEQNTVLTLKRIECYTLMLNHTYPSAGSYCNLTFDDIMCWPDTLAGQTAYLPCPDYIQGFYVTGNVSRTCLPDGTWLTSPKTNLSWTNYSQCIRPSITEHHTEVSAFMTTHVQYIQVMCSTGYAVSFVSLSMAVVIMVRFRKLHCPRNIVHINLFTSFILKAILSFSKDIFWVQGVGFSFDVEQTAEKIIFLQNRTHWECKLFTSVSNYAQTANYFWILIEGLYLHTLVYVSVFSERSSVRWYYLLGWGTPFLSVLPWVAVRVTYENILCWNTNTNLKFVWILKGPIVLTLVINFAFFVNILRALFTKLHKPSTASARRNRYRPLAKVTFILVPFNSLPPTDDFWRQAANDFRKYCGKRRLAKATLILIPLFGVHYIVFLGVPDRIDPTAEIVKLYFEIFFNSFQGFLVAVLFCFLNQEVQMELRKAWYRVWSKPDPVYIQQSQYLADSNGNRRVRKNSNHHHQQQKISQHSSDHSSDIICLCKWTLDKNGKIRREFIRPTSPEKVRKTKSKKKHCETRM